MQNLLYHYCSIETLEMILKNRTFRFSSLGEVDDMEESLTSDFDDIGKICFVSCWTDLEQESVEMWRTYTNRLPGVRIGLPTNFFTQNLIRDESGIPKNNLDITEKYDCMISPPYIPELIPVTYTKDDFLINLPVFESANETCSGCGTKSSSFKLDVKYLGRFKREYWSGQSEWRYRLIAIPTQYYRNNQEGKYLNGNPDEGIELMKNDLISTDFESVQIDYPFDISVLKQMQLTLSPLNTAADNKKVESLLQEYSISTPLNPSSLKIRS